MDHFSTAQNESTTNAMHSWEKLYSKHHDVLREHLNLWTTIRSQQAPSSPHFQTAQKCLDNTQEMIRSFEKLETSHELNNRRANSEGMPATEGTQSKKRDKSTDVPTWSGTVPSTKRQRVERKNSQSGTDLPSHPLRDVSNLFTIDTNPTPVEELLSQARKLNNKVGKNMKRKVSETDLHPKDTNQESGNVQKLQKKSKKSYGKEETKHSSVDVAGMDNIDPDGDTGFETKVAQKHAEKEARRNSRHEKKRKRESNNSLEEHALATFKPTRKKKR